MNVITCHLSLNSAQEKILKDIAIEVPEYLESSLKAHLI